MNNSLLNTAETIMNILNSLPQVKCCKLYGSLANGTYDELSDIDIEIDVSGYDNGKFMMELENLLYSKLNIIFTDYAPSLVPDKYIVSLAIDEENPFLILDLCCTAEPHCTTVSKQQAMSANDFYTHILKLWVANLKHYSRGQDCYDDIFRMASKLGISDIDVKSELELLESVLLWLESNTNTKTEKYVQSCRGCFEDLV